MKAWRNRICIAISSHLCAQISCGKGEEDDTGREQRCICKTNPLFYKVLYIGKGISKKQEDKENAEEKGNIKAKRNAKS